jgi:hypothetical protein
MTGLTYPRGLRVVEHYQVRYLVVRRGFKWRGSDAVCRFASDPLAVPITDPPVQAVLLHRHSYEEDAAGHITVQVPRKDSNVLKNERYRKSRSLALDQQPVCTAGRWSTARRPVRSTAPCLAMAAASQARTPAHLRTHPTTPHHPSPSESASALGQLLKCVSRRARAAGALLELLFDGAVRRARYQDAGGTVIRSACAIAMLSDAGRSQR